MTASFDPVPEPDDRSATMAAPVPYRPRPSRAATVLRWWLALSVLTLFAIALCVFIGFVQKDFAPLNIVIHGDHITDGVTITGIDDGAGALLATGLALLALLLLLMIPLVSLLVAGSVAIVLMCGLGVPLIVLALVLGVVTSPFWMVGLLVWLIARRRDSHRLAGSATMAA
jgi:hypothetical protein